ncbi:hypothetical protein ACXU4B_03710 [Dyella soli]|uniref:Uncharacterized protein n=1 Tax=Dyella soli TaxID=522319 RepID=A0A4R0YXC6_9GAMM|nr:hypothetical protein [Dyella soli]TCI10144.1 hypothetical protein EZM97_14595 [Dyella soli]
MENMPIWGWAGILLAMAVAAIIAAMIKRQADSKARALQERVDSLSGEAARLPDAIGRSDRAEKQVGELTESVRAGAAREAALGAQIEEARLSVERLTDTVAERDRALTQLRENLDTLQRTTATTTANLNANSPKLTNSDLSVTVRERALSGRARPWTSCNGRRR